MKTIIKQIRERPLIITVYLPGPIQFMTDPHAYWRMEMQKLLQQMAAEFSAKHAPIRFRFIDPVLVSYMVGKTVLDNHRHCMKLKRLWKTKELFGLMDHILKRNEKSVDASDMLVTWVKSKKTMRKLCGSVGSWLEFHRAFQQNKPCFLISETPLAIANSHGLHLFKHGGIYRSKDEFLEGMRIRLLHMVMTKQRQRKCAVRRKRAKSKSAHASA